jgi:hypothetical protein
MYNIKSIIFYTLFFLSTSVILYLYSKSLTGNFWDSDIIYYYFLAINILLTLNLIVIFVVRYVVIDSSITQPFLIEKKTTRLPIINFILNLINLGLTIYIIYYFCNFIQDNYVNIYLFYSFSVFNILVNLVHNIYIIKYYLPHKKLQYLTIGVY